MNEVQLHLALTHFPVAGVFFALGGLLWALWRPGSEGARLALGFVVVVGLSGLAAQLSGEGAAEMAERLPGTEGGWIHRHEEAAEAGFIALAVASVLALGGLVVHRRTGGPGRRGLAVIFLAVLTAAALLGRAGHFGGQIRHPEIRAAGDPAAGDPRP